MTKSKSNTKGKAKSRGDITDDVRQMTRATTTSFYLKAKKRRDVILFSMNLMDNIYFLHNDF